MWDLLSKWSQNSVVLLPHPITLNPAPKPMWQISHSYPNSCLFVTGVLICFVFVFIHMIGRCKSSCNLTKIIQPCFFQLRCSVSKLMAEFYSLFLPKPGWSKDHHVRTPFYCLKILNRTSYFSIKISRSKYFTIKLRFPLTPFNN